jgi:hypothetical protein
VVSAIAAVPVALLVMLLVAFISWHSRQCDRKRGNTRLGACVIAVAWCLVTDPPQSYAPAGLLLKQSSTMSARRCRTASSRPLVSSLGARRS